MCELNKECPNHIALDKALNDEEFTWTDCSDCNKCNLKEDER